MLHNKSKGDLTMETKQTAQHVREVVKQEVSNLWEKQSFSDFIFDLLNRWQDEKETEDFNTYKAVIKDALSKLGYSNIIAITKKFELRFYSKVYANILYTMKLSLPDIVETSYKVIKDETIEELKPQPKAEPEVEDFPEDEVDQEELPFTNALAQLPTKMGEKVLDALKYYHKSCGELAQLRKAESILKGIVGKTNYAILDLTPGAEKYEITDKAFSKVFKNKSCGSWKSIVNNSKAFVYEF